MQIQSAIFVTSASKPAQYPENTLPEIAFAGRSNVGKSSLINTLVGRRNLVKTSGTPGKTRLINFFSIDDRFFFVDLPGYGYARVSKKERALWGPMVETYLSGRKNLNGVVILQDIRRNPGDEEHDLVGFLKHVGVPYMFILTKADKFSKNRQTSRIRQIKGCFAVGSLPGFVLFSAKTAQGKEDAWRHIRRLLESAGDLPGEPGREGIPAGKQERP